MSKQQTKQTKTECAGEMILRHMMTHPRYNRPVAGFKLELEDAVIEFWTAYNYQKEVEWCDTCFDEE